jgi:hypothetical protein
LDNSVFVNFKLMKGTSDQPFTHKYVGLIISSYTKPYFVYTKQSTVYTKWYIFVISQNKKPLWKKALGRIVLLIETNNYRIVAKRLNLLPVNHQTAS